ncbi:hypothetical protein EDI_249910 [Entamoeba dispar SAW760]|uniref:Uncharacterized protein n=1 Tax=Entamoeba dispar (strain ATCC PRA-260 / SAW760) TaxID=370354 RepID=B0ES25_ENTDS|nr:uncharacterized protein EDI_249910 [Entamoeba dispar SAW760]EDR22673.1 hypothetical protein EDI_249910 [Entamoeba dispar SAW760]|eukprot:EDR22673.1 hypothetical protein EDI_249910 [Entamoeba dispar SAW760]
MRLLKHNIRKQKQNTNSCSNSTSTTSTSINTTTTTNNNNNCNNNNNSHNTSSIQSIKQSKPRKVSDEINKKYSSLLKKLWENEKLLDKYNLSEEVKTLLNTRMHLWLEYYTINQAMSSNHDSDSNSNSNTNIFEYIDSFSEITSFYN